MNDLPECKNSKSLCCCLLEGTFASGVNTCSGCQFVSSGMGKGNGDQESEFFPDSVGEKEPLSVEELELDLSESPPRFFEHVQLPTKKKHHSRFSDK